MATRYRRLLILIFSAAASLPAGSLFAQTIPLPVTVNRVAVGERVVAINGDDLTMRRQDLEQLGVGGMMWDRLMTFGRMRRVPQPIEGAEAVSLKSLAPLLTYVFDQNNLALDLTVSAALLKPTVVESRSARPADLVYSHDRTGFFNYSVTSPQLREISFFGELGATVGKGLIYSGFSRAVDGHVVRGMTNFIYDDMSHLRRWTAGDAVVVAPALGGSALMTGVTVARDFGLDPYFLRFPSLDLAGTATTPSQVDVYVNGVLVGRHDVPPGPFQLRDVPVAAGSGSTQIVVRDAFGRQQSASTNYYFATNLLTPGLSEYLYSVGTIREDFGVKSFSSGDPAALGYHRIGVSDSLTIGARGEASRQLWSGGPIIDLDSRIGEWRIAGSFSSDHGSTGTAGELGYRYIARRFGFGGTVRKLSDSYSTISMRATNDRPLLDATVFGSISGRAGSITAQWTKFDMRDSPDVMRTTLGASMPLGSRAALLASATAVSENGVRHNEYFAGASVNFGFATTASLSIGSRGDGHYDTIAEVQRALPIGEGYGYRLQTQVSDGGDRVDLGTFQYQTSFGRYEIAEAPSGNERRPSLTASGGVVFAGRNVHFAQPVQESYAIVEVPGVNDVRVYASNQLVGRTNSHGMLLVPNLLAYYGNPLHIEDKDIPMAYEVGGVEKTVAPPYRGGAVVVFPVKQHRSIVGKLIIRKGAERISPALGTFAVSVAGAKSESPIGRGGEFYLEDIAAGAYDAVIDWTGGQCKFRLSVPGSKEETVNLGEVACEQR